MDLFPIIAEDEAPAQAVFDRIAFRTISCWLFEQPTQ
jgi:hypothetical protein